MPAVIRLTATDETKQAFDSLNRNLDQAERNAEQSGDALNDVFEDVDAIREYDAALQRTAAELRDVGQAAHEARQETEGLGGQAGGLDDLSGKVTALSTGLMAVGEGARFVADVGQAAYDVISQLAEEGDEGMADLKREIDSVGDALQRLGGETLRVSLGGDASATAEQVDLLASAIDALTERVKRGPTEADWKRLLFEGPGAALGRMVGESPQDAGAAEEAARERERAVAQQRAREALGAVDKAIAEQAFERRLEEIGQLEEVNKLIRERRGLLNETAEGRLGGGNEAALAEELLKLEQRRQDLIEQRAEAERDAARGAERERTRMTEAEAKERAEVEKRFHEQAARHGVDVHRDAERAKTEVAKEEAEARRMAEETEARHLAAMQRAVFGEDGKGFDRDAAIQQIMEGRIRQAQEAAGPGADEEELERIRRQQARRTNLDAMGNRLHTDELGQQEKYLAELARREIEAAQRRNGGGQAAQQQAAQQQAGISEQLVRNQNALEGVLAEFGKGLNQLMNFASELAADIAQLKRAAELQNAHHRAHMERLRDTKGRRGL